MPTRRRNPYSPGTQHHHLWEEWNDQFFDQPIHGQLYQVESELHLIIKRLTLLCNRLTDPTIKREMRNHIIQLEAEANQIGKMAEHARVDHIREDRT
jgi:hypothetical protein